MDEDRAYVAEICKGLALRNLLELKKKVFKLCYEDKLDFVAFSEES